MEQSIPAISKIEENISLRQTIKEKEDVWDSEKKYLRNQVEIMQRKFNQLNEKQNQLKMKNQEQMNVLNNTDFSFKENKSLQSWDEIDIKGMQKEELYTQENEIDEEEEDYITKIRYTNSSNDTYTNFDPRIIQYQLEQLQQVSQKSKNSSKYQVSAEKLSNSKNSKEEPNFKKRHLRITSATNVSIAKEIEKAKMQLQSGKNENLKSINFTSSHNPRAYKAILTQNTPARVKKRNRDVSSGYMLVLDDSKNQLNSKPPISQKPQEPASRRSQQTHFTHKSKKTQNTDNEIRKFSASTTASQFKKKKNVAKDPRFVLKLKQNSIKRREKNLKRLFKNSEIDNNFELFCKAC